MWLAHNHFSRWNFIWNSIHLIWLTCGRATNVIYTWHSDTLRCTIATPCVGHSPRIQRLLTVGSAQQTQIRRWATEEGADEYLTWWWTRFMCSAWLNAPTLACEFTSNALCTPKGGYRTSIWSKNIPNLKKSRTTSRGKHGILLQSKYCNLGDLQDSLQIRNGRPLICSSTCIKVYLVGTSDRRKCVSLDVCV